MAETEKISERGGGGVITDHHKPKLISFAMFDEINSLARTCLSKRDMIVFNLFRFNHSLERVSFPSQLCLKISNFQPCALQAVRVTLER